ncbi:MAG TPA: DNA repair protein RadC [Candidatus Woesebacteria bacterium]|nr:DNA repair protein RadC [Candidatus Woesebacteria bacterium]
MKIKDLPSHLKPREKLITKGVENLKDEELLAILFRTGNKKANVIELSKIVLQKYPLTDLIQKNYDDLKIISGIDIGKATALIAAFELGKRALKKENDNLIIQTPKDVYIQVSEIRTLKKEYLVALFLNARNQLLLKETISVGTLTASLVHPREVFEPALRVSAASVIIVHNHPSGNTEPSQQDIDMTLRLIKSGNLLGIELLDHIIVSNNGYSSLKELGTI